MDVKNLIMGVIALSLGAVMIAGALLPAVASASDDQHEYYNNSVGQYSKVINEPVTINYTYDSDSNLITYSVNGVDQSLMPNYNDMIFATSHATFKVTLSAQNSSYILWLDDTQGSRRVDNPKSVSAEINIDSVTATVVKSDNNTESFTVGINWGFYAVTNGDYRAVWSPYNVYINDINQVYSVNWLNTTSQFFSIHGESVIYGGGDATVNYNLTPVSGVIDVSKFANGDFTITVDNGGTPYTGAPFNVIVPVEIIGDKSGFSDVISNMFGVLPIVVVAGLVMAGIYIFISRK